MKNEKLKKQREKKKLTQQEVADKVGISVISYQRIERGTQRPNLATALKISNILKKSVNALFEDII